MEPGINISNVRVTTKANGAGAVEIDGRDIAGSVRSVRISAGVHEMTTIELEILPRKAAEYEGDAFVRLDPSFEDFLTALGWQPPRRP